MALSESMGPADIAALTGNNNGMFSDCGSFWIIILFLFAFNGWGGFGGYGRGGSESGAVDNYVLASDFSQVERKLDTVNAGLCDGFYAMNTGMLNGFAGINNAINTSGYEIRNAITQDTIANMQNANALQAQLANCCCENKQAIAGVNYNLSTSTRDVVENANANTRAILDALQAQAIAAKDAKIAEQTQQITALQLAASQSAQNNYLIERLQPAPVPSFSVPAPYAYGGCGCRCN